MRNALAGVALGTAMAAGSCELKEAPVVGPQIIVGNPEVNKQDESDTMELSGLAGRLVEANGQEVAGIKARKDKILSAHGINPDAYRIIRGVNGQVRREVDKAVCPEYANPYCEKIGDGVDLEKIIEAREAGLQPSLDTLDKLRERYNEFEIPKAAPRSSDAVAEHGGQE